MDLYALTNHGLLRLLGERVQRARLNQNMSQRQLAQRAGLSMRTVSLVENGKGVGLLVFVRVLRALRMLEQLDAFMPPVLVSPIDVARLEGRVRQRASTKKGPGVFKTARPKRLSKPPRRK